MAEADYPQPIKKASLKVSEELKEESEESTDEKSSQELQESAKPKPGRPPIEMKPKPSEVTEAIYDHIRTNFIKIENEYGPQILAKKAGKLIPKKGKKPENISEGIRKKAFRIIWDIPTILRDLYISEGYRKNCNTLCETFFRNIVDSLIHT